MDFAQIKDNLIIKLLGKERNEKLLMEVPHLTYMDLVILFYVYRENREGKPVATLVYNNRFENWGRPLDELYQVARSNTQRLMPSIFITMEEALEDLTGATFHSAEPVMYVLSNERKCFGASVLLYENKLNEIGDMIQDDFYILPSSIHEVIIVPKEKTRDKEELTEMVQQVNFSQLMEEEVLSDHAYFYSRVENTIYC